MSSMYMEDNLIGLDFETYGAVSLPDHGLERYVSDDSFLPLIASTAEVNPGGSGLLPSGRVLPDGRTLRRRHWCLWDGSDVEALKQHLAGRVVCAHNAGFEERVNRWLKILNVADYIDSAVLARAMGAASKLEAAAPQLLNSYKLADGWRLIKLFSIPSVEQHNAGRRSFDPQLIEDNLDDWDLFQHYCDIDAELSLRLVLLAISDGYFTVQEQRYQNITMHMNEVGWHVDVPLVEEMQRRFLENQEVELAKFRQECDAEDLNLNSLPQQKQWCAERGVKALSFDVAHVASLAEKIDRRLAGMQPEDQRYVEYTEVLRMLRAKQVLGGSSLKKLKVILDTTGADAKLRDQYLHIGAGQTWRTTGRSVQMQNLKRMGAEADDMLELFDMDVDWDNDKLAHNMRQVFTSSHPQGRLIVGDFSSVESRGLAWLANAEWKLNEYRAGKDMYKVLASTQFGVAYDAVTKPQRTFGKVGELSCGYQAAGGAVQSFAAGMGVDLSEGEAASIVSDWRRINPEIVALWAELDRALHEALAYGRSTTSVGPNSAVAGRYVVEIMHGITPASLKEIDPHCRSLLVILRTPWGLEYMRRVFHGVYKRGRSLCYYKPTDKKSGPVWVNHFKDPKTKQVKFYNIYGGKLAGILTQSLCRQLFFEVLNRVYRKTRDISSVELIGQFHDEIVLDWQPGNYSLDNTMAKLKRIMSACNLPGFPLAADIKNDYRYTK